MKNAMKMLVVVVAVAAAQMNFARQAFAATKGEVSFELYNKDASTITIKSFVVIGGREIAPLSGLQISSGNNKSMDIIVNNPKDFALVMEIKKDNAIYNYQITPFMNDNKPENKTVFVTFDSAKSQNKLYPQTGPLGGLSGKTKSGKSLANNITASQIKETKIK